MKSTLPYETPLPVWIANSPICAAATALYRGATDYRNTRFDAHPEKITTVTAPVISVGGIRVGGSGKTPATMLLVDYLSRMGKEVAVLSRGYRRKSREDHIVPPHQKCLWSDIGDEPAMMRTSFQQVWLGIGANRSENARRLISHMGSNAVFIMDDGFQHRKLHRDLDVVCIHETLFEDRMLPQGYLREPVSALSRADLFFCIVDDRTKNKMKTVCKELEHRFPATGQVVLESVFEGWVNAASGMIATRPPCKEPVAFCGIARPERFFDLLARQDIGVSFKKTFPDHYIYRECDVSFLQKLYSKGFVTTEKDMVRLAGIPELPKEQLWYSKIRLSISEKESLTTLSQYIMKSVL